MCRFMKLSALATVVGWFLCGPPALRAAELVIADGGRSDYTIVIASEASDSEKHGATELQMFLEQISAAKLPIATDADAVNGPMILVGRSKKLAELELKIDFEPLGDEGFVVHTAPPHLVLAGGRTRGSMYAVYTFLEDHLDCRWWTDTASRIPKRERIEIGPLQERHAPPAIRYRWVSGEPDWGARNKLNTYFIRADGDLYDGVHTFFKYLPPEEHFEKHPEYFSLVSGERRNNAQICLTHPEVVKIVAENVKKRLREKPSIDILSVSQRDGFGGACECTECQALVDAEGSQSGPVVNFVNQVADIVGKEFPDVAIGTLAYLYTKKPPKTIRPRPNVVIRMGTIQKCLSHSSATCDFVHTATFRENITGWGKLTDRIHVWDYVISFHHYLLPFPNLEAIGPTAKYFAENSVRGVLWQDRQAGEVKDLRRYMLAKITWNPDVDARAVRDEFLEGFYGPAAGPIGEYLDMIHKKAVGDNVHMFIWAKPQDAYLTPEILSRARELFDEAERRVEGQPELVERVEMARLAIQYAELCRPTPYVDSAPIYARFKAVVEREKIEHYGEGGFYMSAWLAEKQALFGALPENVVYDLFQNVGAATHENNYKFEVNAVKKGDGMVPAILQHPPNEGIGTAAWEIQLPALENGKKLVLRFGTGFREPTTNGVGFTILIDGKEVWSTEQKDLEPVDHEIDVSDWAGKTLRLSLHVDALGNGEYDWSGWVRPQIVIVPREGSG